MMIYAINPEKNNTILTCLICIKYTDSQSLIKLFSILKALYDFEPIFITTDFDKSQIYALKNCELFIKKPFIICCFFHYVQCIIKHFKKFKIIKKKLNKHAYEILRNLEVLAFIDKKNIEIYFKFLKDQLIENDNDQLFFNYYENYWIKKNKNYFNYSDLVTDILKIKKKNINENGNKNIEKNLISELKGLEKLYFTNNLCETVHSHISNNLPNNKITKTNFRDTVNTIIEKYKIIDEKTIRKDFISRTLIILMIKLNLNEKPKIISYDLFKNELQKSICVMTNNININFVNEIIHFIENYEHEDINDIYFNKKKMIL